MPSKKRFRRLVRPSNTPADNVNWLLPNCRLRRLFRPLNTPAGSVVNWFLRTVSSLSLFRPSNTPAGNMVNWLASRFNVRTLVRPAKSPPAKAVNCFSLRSSEKIHTILSDSTAAQSSAPSASKMASRTCAVRSQMSTVCACAGSTPTASKRQASSNLMVPSFPNAGRYAKLIAPPTSHSVGLPAQRLLVGNADRRYVGKRRALVDLSELKPTTKRLAHNMLLPGLKVCATAARRRALSRSRPPGRGRPAPGESRHLDRPASAGPVAPR